MIVDLPDTTVSNISKALVKIREEGGAVALGRVLTLIIATHLGQEEEAIEAANDASREHPMRVIVVSTEEERSTKGEGRLDAQIRVGGDAGASEVIVLRAYGETASDEEGLVTGLLLPASGKLPDDHLQVWRLTSDDGQSLLGRLIPAPLVERIASAFGISAHVEIDLGARVEHVRTSGEIMPIGALRLKRALVAGDQRLELLDWKPEALPHLKAAGCFTEIIQHRTRLFVPPSRALEILARITD